MCGICGAVSLDGPLAPGVRASVRAMAAALAHRGPDGEGFHDTEQAAIGHRRLSIIDLAGGAQPMGNEDGSCWIAFNGEIYNHRRLRPVLESRGHVFRTHSDTEVILHAWEEYGTSCVDHLDGMFAFAVVDMRRRELFLARDRLGKKPLFYTVAGGVLHFASELPALARSPLWRGDVSLDGIDAYLALGYFLAPQTVFRDVWKLPPAHWLRLKDGHIETRRYWDVIEFGTDGRDEEALLEEIDGALAEAVRDRLESEVPLGAFLSGGIDSGLIVSYMAKAIDEPVRTATVGFGEAGHDELDAARAAARAFGTAHSEERLTPRLDEVFDSLVERLGEPMADSSAIPTWYVSRSARSHVTVALSGDGGDETFAGYDFRYVPHAFEAAARSRLGPGPARLLGRTLGPLWPRSRKLPRPLRVGTLLDNLARDPAEAYFVDLCFLKPPHVARLLGRPGGAGSIAGPTAEAVMDVYRRCPSPDALQRAQYADLHVYMPNDPLVKVDRMGMAHGLEIRCPLLDRRVVELAFRIPSRRHQRGSTGKVLLRALARKRLPPGHADLPKRGFTVPIGSWIGGPYADRFRDEVLTPGARVSGLLDRSHLLEAFEAHRSGRADREYLLWAVWVLERWLRSCGERAMAPAAAGTP